MSDRRYRPRYETADDLTRERFVADQLMKVGGLRLQKLPVHYLVDFFHPRRIVEVKCRQHAHDAYPTLMLSLAKWQAGIYLAHLMHPQTVFVVAAGFTDGIWTCSVAHKALPDYDIKMGGRTKQTRDGADIEPVVHIPVDDMKLITEKSPWV
jgi:hypothetical protein